MFNVLFSLISVAKNFVRSLYFVSSNLKFSPQYENAALEENHVQEKKRKAVVKECRSIMELTVVLFFHD